MPELEADIRGCLVADPGCLLVGADYSQIEQRVMATLAGEEKLIEAIKSGIDFHKAVARDMYNVATEDVTSLQRELAKRAGYLMIYGGGPKKLALSTNIPLAQAKEVIKKFKASYPKVVSYAEFLQTQAEIVTPYGRHLPIDPARRYAATNYMIQSTARDLFVIGGVNIVKAGLGKYLWLPVHDEWILNTPEDRAAQIAESLGDIMFIDFYGTPIEAEGVVMGKRWRKT